VQDPTIKPAGAAAAGAGTASDSSSGIHSDGALGLDDADRFDADDGAMRGDAEYAARNPHVFSHFTTADAVARKERVTAMSTDASLYERLAHSLAPSIWEMEDVKKGVLLQLFGGACCLRRRLGCVLVCNWHTDAPIALVLQASSRTSARRPRCAARSTSCWSATLVWQSRSFSATCTR